MGNNVQKAELYKIVKSINNEDVKLRETENAWRPARLIDNRSLTDDELKTVELYKKVRGVLNKITPEKFERLLNQVRALSIDNQERLQGVIDLVFEKAVDEPNFSVAYALMCKELALMQVPANNKSNKEEQQFVNFRKLLITRCQIEFEKNSADENARNIKLKEIDECTDPEKKKELQFLLEDDDRRMRDKSLGNIRFIGELFKQQMLTVKIMLRCINILLENKDEDSLECLCILLTTVGKDLELMKSQNLQPYFAIMQEIVNKKHGKISNRVRFKLQDVIDLKNSKWVPRKQDSNPKTMQHFQNVADTEPLNIQVINSGPMSTPRKDYRMGNPGGSKRRNNQTNESGWSMAGPRNRTTYTVESSKLIIKPPPMDEITLGSKNLFGNWDHSSNTKTQQSPFEMEIRSLLHKRSLGEHLTSEASLKHESVVLCKSQKDKVHKNKIHVISVWEDVTLKKRGDILKSGHLSYNSNLTDDKNQSITLYKIVQSVLNKLKPKNFEKLLNKVRALPIDTEERLQDIVDLIYEKAVEEHYSSTAPVLYALMCKELALMQVPATNKSNNKEEQQYTNFRKLLITRCQIEFEKNSADEYERNLKVKEIDACTDPDMKKELQFILEEDDRRICIQSIRNLRFIGELFKQQMLTVKVMLRCINILLENKDEDSLECLCTLLTTVGKDLELIKSQNLQPYFAIMQEIVDKKHGKISNRVRSMLKDIIDLRNSKWMPKTRGPELLNHESETVCNSKKEKEGVNNNNPTKIQVISVWEDVTFRDIGTSFSHQ